MNIKNIIFDLEGVVYRSSTPISDSIVTINKLSKNYQVAYFTNASVRKRVDYVNKLESMGVRTSIEHIMTSSYATVTYLDEEYSDVKNILAIGESSFIEELKNTKHNISTVNSDSVFTKYDIVVMGFDINFSYTKLLVAQQAILDGAIFITTDIDKVYPHENGRYYPSIGWQVKSIELLTNTNIKFCGKPSAYGLIKLLQTIDGLPQETLVVGDSLSSDIAAGISANCHTCHLKSDIVEFMRDANHIEPEFSINKLSNLLEIL